MPVIQSLMKVLSMDIRRLNASSKHRRINQFIHSVRVDQIGIQESKLSFVSNPFANRLLGSQNVSFGSLRPLILRGSGG